MTRKSKTPERVGYISSPVSAKFLDRCLKKNENSIPSVIMYGPTACGKTTKALAIRDMLGLASVLDNWMPSRPFPAKDTLVITEGTEGHPPSFGSHESISFDEAMRRFQADSVIK